LAGIAFALILLLALLLRLAGIGDFDVSDYHHAVRGHLISRGDLTVRLAGKNPNPFRIGVHLGVAPFYALFGVSPITTALFPLACSLGSIVLVYLILKYHFQDARAGLVGMLLAAIIPSHIYVSTRLVGTDVMVAFFATLALYVALRVAKRDSPFSPGGWFIYALLGGLCGYVWLMKAPGLYVLLAALLVTAVRFGLKRSVKPCALIAAGFAAVIAAEMLFYWCQLGSPLARFESLSRARYQRVVEKSFLDYLRFNLIRQGRYWRWALATMVVIYLGFFASFFCLWKGTRNHRAVGVWTLTNLAFWLAQEFNTLQTQHFRLFPPFFSALIVAASVASILKRPVARVFLILLCLTPGLAWYQSGAATSLKRRGLFILRARSSRYHAVREFLRFFERYSHWRKPLYVPDGSGEGRILLLCAGWKREAREGIISLTRSDGPNLTKKLRLHRRPEDQEAVIGRLHDSYIFCFISNTTGRPAPRMLPDLWKYVSHWKEVWRHTGEGDAPGMILYYAE